MVQVPTSHAQMQWTVCSLLYANINAVTSWLAQCSVEVSAQVAGNQAKLNSNSRGDVTSASSITSILWALVHRGSVRNWRGKLVRHSPLVSGCNGDPSNKL